MNFLKKIFLFAWAIFLSVSAGNAMDDCPVQVPNTLKPFVVDFPDKKEIHTLKEFIIEGFKKDTLKACPPKELLEEVVSAIDLLQGYIGRNQNNPFKKRTVQTQTDYNNAEIDFSRIVKMFYYVFDSWLKFECNGYIKNFPECPIVCNRDIQEKFYPQYKDYFNIFQRLSNSFFCVRARNQSHLPLMDVEVIITKEPGLGVGAFREEGGYVPFPLVPEEYCWPIPIFYGAQQNPQKHFVFSEGNLVADTGILISPNPDKGYFKFLGQYGQDHAFPYTCVRLTLRVPFDDNTLFLQSLKNVLGEEAMKRDFHFISLPHTVEEQNMLELLILEDLLAEKKKYAGEEGLFPAQKFIEWMESEEGVGLPLEEIHQLVEEQMKDQVIPQKGIKEESRKVSKGHKKGSKKQKCKGPQKFSEKSRQKDKREEVFEKIKQEGRIKFQKIQGIINEIFKSAGNEEIYRKFLTVKKGGSHITFHCLEQEPLTLVRKHGKDDLTVPASQVNRFSLRLINILLVGEES